MGMMHAPESLLKEHYADLSKKGFFSEPIRYMGSGAVVPMVWQGLGAVKQGRVLLGATNPKDSAPGTIRGDLCIDVGRNIIHGSDSVESAEKEIGLWFSQAEITSWRSAQTEWVYEEEELEPLPVLPSKVDGLVSASGSSEDMALVKKSSHGTTRLTTTQCSPPSRASRWMVCFGAPTSSSPSATASRSCR